MSRPVLLDSSFLIALERETASGSIGPARKFLPSLRALLQRSAARRLGENDAWLVATADLLDADVVAADRTAFTRLGTRYLRFT